MPGVQYQALAASHAPAELISTQPVSHDDPLYNFEIHDAPSIVDMAAMETLPATTIAQLEVVFLTEPAGHSVHVPSRLEDQDDLPAHAHMNLRRGAQELHNVLAASQYVSDATDADVDRCGLNGISNYKNT